MKLSSQSQDALRPLHRSGSRWLLPHQLASAGWEVGLQNAGHGSVLALAHLGEAGTVPSALYAALRVATAAAALPLTRSGKQPQRADPCPAGVARGGALTTNDQ